MILKETCELALRLSQWRKETKDGVSEGHEPVFRDAAPPFNSKDLTFLKDRILKGDLFEKYRAMYTLRNLNSESAATLMCQALESDSSTLFRHQICVELSKMSPSLFPAITPTLTRVLTSPFYPSMVKHEAILAMAALDPGAIPKIEHHDPIVIESL